MNTTVSDAAGPAANSLTPAAFIPSAGWQGTLSAAHLARLDAELPEPECFGSYDGPHAAVVIDRVVSYCSCGWHPARHPNFTLADHLHAMGELPPSRSF